METPTTRQSKLNAAIASLTATGAVVQSAIICGDTRNPILAVCGVWNGEVWACAR